MRIGASLFLIAIGAILKFAVSANASGVDIQMIGVILMIVGAVGLVISIIWASTRRRTDIVEHGPGMHSSRTYVMPRDPYE
jgi:hypothetical protein